MGQPQRIIGVDFTSAPSWKKPLTWAEALLKGAELRVTEVICLTSFAEFEAKLREPGPWIAAMDFPFSMPRRLIENLNLPRDWESVVDDLCQGGRAEFAARIRAYAGARPYGDRYHFREVDRLAVSCSPMMVDYTPVGRMFAEGARYLKEAPVSILPVRPLDTSAIVVEAYPKLVVKALIPGRSYKGDSIAKASARQAARSDLWQILQSQCADHYGFRLNVDDPFAEAAIADPSGDTVDAILCAIQGAWAARSTDPPFGIPPNVDLLEGWIVDPQMLVAR